LAPIITGVTYRRGLTMASTAPSRFALLTDDASDPFAKAKKVKAKTTNSGPNTTKPGTSSSSSQQKKAKDKKNQATTGANAATQKVFEPSAM